jgi:magnesium chelatase family protein
LLNEFIIFGELSLDGNVCPVQGTLALTHAARTHGFTKLMVPQANAREAAVVSGVEVFAVDHLLRAIDFLNQKTTLAPHEVDVQQLFRKQSAHQVDFADVRGQGHAKRALEVAAAGGHNLLMIGPPGSGKSMLANRMPTILPELTLAEALETTAVYSVSSQLPPNCSLVTTRPFRAPHHTVSNVALIGGGTYPKPGEVSLAHHGVLFLDELPEFSKHALEVLRQPLEDGRVSIARTAAAVTYPCRFMLLAAMNPCPCGYFADPTKNCTCMPHQIHKYLGKISGPLLDRFDIHLEVPSVKYPELTGQEESEPSAVIRRRVADGRAFQAKRYARHDPTMVNAHLSARLVRQYCRLGDSGQAVMKAAIDRLGLSARAYHRVLKVARTIADLEASEAIAARHVSEAIQYRALDKRYWQHQGLT